MSDTESYALTAGERDARDLADDVPDLLADTFRLTGDEIPEELDVGNLDELVAATSPDVDDVPSDEDIPDDRDTSEDEEPS